MWLWLENQILLDPWLKPRTSALHLYATSVKHLVLSLGERFGFYMTFSVWLFTNGGAGFSTHTNYESFL